MPGLRYRLCSRRARLCRTAFSVLAMASLAACGGGGASTSNSTLDIQMSLSRQSISVAATTADQAPQATFQVYVSGVASNKTVYLGEYPTDNGIAGVTLGSSQRFPATVTVGFKPPANLAVGTYKDTIEVDTCLDPTCKQPLPNSPLYVYTTYTVTDGPYQVSAISPSSAIAGGAGFTLTVTGSKFTTASTVSWNGTALPTRFVRSTELDAQVSAADIATAADVSVSVSDPANGASNTAVFSVRRYTITGLSPAFALVGAPDLTLSVAGSTFTPDSVVQWNGMPLATTFVSASSLTALVPAADLTAAGTASITVADPAIGTTNTQTFAIDLTPLTLSSISPISIDQGGPAFTLTAIGTGFTSSSAVAWNGINLSTTYVSATELEAQVPATYIASDGTASITVTDGLARVTGAVTFTVVHPPLTLTTISPAKVTVNGAPFELTVLGKGFSASSAVLWNGGSLSTTYISSTELTAQVPAADITATGTASIAVSDPTNSPTITSALSLSVVPASIDATALQMNPAHTGVVTFKSITLPSATTWSTDVGGTPSYALIADGEVIVTVKLGTDSSEILALNQADGAIAWGPIALAGVAAAAYDNGQVFVLSGSHSDLNTTAQAFDVATGALNWTTSIGGSYDFGSLPVAADGTLYFGADVGVAALYEADGAQKWREYNYGSGITPALSADGLYSAYFCQATDLRPATGEVIWTKNNGCGGGATGMPAATNQLVYTKFAGLDYGGDIFDAASGAVVDSFAADAPPAITSTTGYYLQAGTLKAINLADGTVQWSFTGDGNLLGAPIVVNQYVFIASTAGNIYALDSTTGTQAWTDSLSAGIDLNVGARPSSAIAAGDGLLVVPSGTKVIAYTLSTNP